MTQINAIVEVLSVEPDREAPLTALTETGDQSRGLANISSRIRLVSDDVDHPISTYVAGTVGSLMFDVTKNATIVSIKITNRVYGMTTRIIESLEWSVQNITSTTGRAGCSVIKMSLGSPVVATASNHAVDATIALGVVLVVSSGDDEKDAWRNRLQVSLVPSLSASFPSKAQGQLADIKYASFNNDGAILSSGTSMSTPHVADLALYLKALEGSALNSTTSIADWIKALAG
ncbi:alkaline proteinase [Colletotrichum incanum]|uniref:Alkaline proteinase n=1 Tax=Colletotrichum incanum TaxID=1573173 RepID=A0A167DSY5_COLIC|nr:alkaline proteinase [Colletotrichum incanum]OHW96475.1 alkaline proteinase [Colletotrichum incanum]